MSQTDSGHHRNGTTAERWSIVRSFIHLHFHLQFANKESRLLPGLVNRTHTHLPTWGVRIYLPDDGDEHGNCATHKLLYYNDFTVVGTRSFHRVVLCQKFWYGGERLKSKDIISTTVILLALKFTKLLSIKIVVWWLQYFHLHIKLLCYIFLQKIISQKPVKWNFAKKKWK